MLRFVPLRALAVLAVAGLAFGCASAQGETTSSARQQLDFGVKMAEQGLWNEAVFRFEQARTLDPRNVRVLNNLAISYEAVGRFDDALAAYRSALEVNANERRVRQNYTRFLEFYQSFKVRKAPPAATPAPPAEAPAPPGATPAPPPPSGSGS